MSFERLIEQKIQEAMARGDFDNLPGRGQPIDLTAYFDTPEDVRAAYALLKNARLVPREVEILQEIATLKDQLSTASSADQKRKISRRIQELHIQYTVMLERQKRQRKQG